MSKITIIDFETCGLREYPSVAAHIAALERIADEMAKGEHHMLTSAYAYSQVPVSPNPAAMPDIVCYEAGAMFEFKHNPVADFGLRRTLQEEWYEALFAKGFPVGPIRDWKQPYIPWGMMPAFVTADGTLWRSYRDLIERESMTQDEWRKLYECQFTLDDLEDYSYESAHRNRGRQTHEDERKVHRPHASRRREEDRDGRERDGGDDAFGRPRARSLWRDRPYDF